MKDFPRRSPISPPATCKNGSTLLITLLVVSLLLIVVLSLVAKVRMELRQVTDQQNVAVARANARLGLELAIAQLQQYAGPDQRVTAPATTVFPSKDVTTMTGDLFEDPAVGYRTFAQRSNTRSYLNRVETYLVPDERDDWNDALTQWWNQQGRNPHWTGIFDSSLRVDRATNPAGPPLPLPPQRAESPPQPTFGEPKRDQLPVWLVSGNERFNFDQNTATAYPAGYLTPLDDLGDPATDPDVIELVSTGTTPSVDGIDSRVHVLRQPSEGNATRFGSYAYWVADESTKANFGVIDPYAAAAEGTVEYRNRLQVPQRLGWERITGIDAINLDPNAPEFLKLASTAQIQHLDPTAEQPVRAAFHHLTSHSQSLLTDTALGGLKKDLTRYLEDGQGLADNDPIPDATLYDPQDPRFRAWGGTNTGFPANAAADGLPTWGQVRDWYQNTSAGGTITPNAQTAPVMTYIMFHAGLSYNSSSREIHWHWAPAIVLWNPYDARLASASYDIEVEVSPILDRFNVVNENPTLAELQSDTDAEWDMRPVGPELAPGVRQIVRSFRSPQTNPETGGFHWPVITADNPLYQGSEFGTLPGQSSNPDAYNIGANGPFTYDRTFSDGTSDAFGNRHYNLRLVSTLSGRAVDPNSTRNPSIDCDDASDFNNNGGANGSGGGNSGKNWDQGLRFAPMTSDFNNRDPADTRLRFRISSGFAPGESRIFSLSSAVAWNPVSAPAVPLQTGFESDFPGTVHFPVLEVVNGPSSANGLRFYFETLNQNRVAPKVRITLGGEVIQETDWFAGEGATSTFVMGENLQRYGTGSWGGEDTDGDGVLNRDEHKPQFISLWRPMYDLDDFHDEIQPYVLNTGDQRSPLFDWGQHYFTPLTSPGRGTRDDVFFSYTPMFSRFNFSGRAIDRHPLLDQLRDRYGINNRNHLGNQEGLSRIELFSSYSKASSPRWDNDQYTGNRGYSLITYRERPGDLFVGLSELPVRLARRPNSNILSLGQFQQINLSPYAWQPAFPIGNSWAGIYNDREAIAGIHSRRPGIASRWTNASPVSRQPQNLPNSMAFSITASGQPNVQVPANSMLDMSYVLNENLWDRYFLSTIPASPSPAVPLPNSRHRYADSAATAGAELTDFDTAAAHVRNHGALNVNSTSVEAWKALLSAFRDLSLGDNPDDTAPVARTLDPIGDSIRFTLTGINSSHIGATSTNKDYERILNGFRYLDDTMIQALAERIVDEVRLRGPFFSMGDFVNRRLNAPQGSNQSGTPWFTARTQGWISTTGRVQTLNNMLDFLDPSYDPFVGLHGLTGPLQRAIDLSGINGGVNHPDLGPAGTGNSNNQDGVFSPKIRNSSQGALDTKNEFLSNGIGGAGNVVDRHTHEPSIRGHIDTEHLAGAPAGEVGFLMQGTPGFITQGDLLAMLGPALTARGDTFLIRTYGDRTDSTGATVQARAYLEAVVQRVPEPVTPAATTGPDAWRPDDPFGRRFEIIRVRWLIPEEI